MKGKQARREYRLRRTRTKLAVNLERPRLSVHHSNRHLYAQVVDDLQGATLAYVSSLSKELAGDPPGGTKGRKNKNTAAKVGELIAKKALGKGVKRVRFDRGARIYHGRVKAVAEAARAAGLEF